MCCNFACQWHRNHKNLSCIHFAAHNWQCIIFGFVFSFPQTKAKKEKKLNTAVQTQPKKIHIMQTALDLMLETKFTKSWDLGRKHQVFRSHCKYLTTTTMKITKSSNNNNYTIKSNICAERFGESMCQEVANVCIDSWKCHRLDSFCFYVRVTKIFVFVFFSRLNGGLYWVIFGKLNRQLFAICFNFCPRFTSHHLEETHRQKSLTTVFVCFCLFVLCGSYIIGNTVTLRLE